MVDDNINQAGNSSAGHHGTLGGNSQSHAASGGSALDPMKLLRMVLRRWPLMLLFAGLGGLGGIIKYAVTDPIYLAKADIEMSIRRPKVINNEVMFEDNSGAGEDVVFNTRFAKFRSPAMEDLASRVFFERYPAGEYIRRKSGVGVEKLAFWVRQVNWWKDSQANIVNVSFESTDAEFAARLVNVMTDCAGMLMVQENQALSDGAVQWLLTQAEEKRDSLEIVEGQLADIRQELQLDSVEQRRGLLDTMQSTLTQEKALLENQLASRETVYEFIKTLKESDDSLETLPTGLPKEQQLSELLAAWQAANDQLLQISDRFTELHPQYQQAAEQEGRARNRLDQFIALTTKAVQNEIKLLGKQVMQVDERVEAMKKESLDLDDKLAEGDRRLQRLERQREAADISYQSVLTRMEEARLAADENTAYVKVIREAAVPIIPEAPVKSKMLLAGIFIGGVLGAGIAILLELLKDTIASVNELRALGLTILGALPSVRPVIARGELAMIGVKDKFSPVVEVFAGIGNLVSSEKYKRQTKVLMLCSGLPGEGKTVSACNLAISCANNGSKTLLIDGDLRRPRVAGVFRIDEDHPSLLEWMADGGETLEHDDLVSPNVVENLDVITSRPLRDISPSEFLGRRPLRDLIDWARKDYDRIIIDSPPLGIVGDGLVLADHADAVILVSRIGVGRRRTLKFVMGQLKAIEAPVLGCIANDVPHSLAGKFGGGEGYGSGSRYNSYING